MMSTRGSDSLSTASRRPRSRSRSWSRRTCTWCARRRCGSGAGEWRRRWRRAWRARRRRPRRGSSRRCKGRSNKCMPAITRDDRTNASVSNARYMDVKTSASKLAKAHTGIASNGPALFWNDKAQKAGVPIMTGGVPGPARRGAAAVVSV